MLKILEAQKKREIFATGLVADQNDRQCQQASLMRQQEELARQKAHETKEESELQEYLQSLAGLSQKNSPDVNSRLSSLISVITAEHSLLSKRRQFINDMQLWISKQRDLVRDIDRIIALRRQGLKEIDKTIIILRSVLNDSEDILRREMFLSPVSAPQMHVILAINDRSDAPSARKKELLDALRDRAKEVADKIIDRYIPGGDNATAKTITHALIEMNPAKALGGAVVSPSQTSRDQDRVPSPVPSPITSATGKNDPLGGTAGPKVNGQYVGPDPPKSPDKLYADRNLPGRSTMTDSRSAPPAYANGPSRSPGGGGAGSGASGGGGGSSSSGHGVGHEPGQVVR